ncbi:restriction endonuclease subunit S [Mariprofundus erugo]|uniref:Restriction endonuclease subunit S n=1 Tax=Mariprofundus erugo TaxID=2528639 RepID=A0A5R9GJW7_9PROT|nr:restriction endonuclease subunit S [Mariprofundus erugo]TLS66500.1 restriction endonuclease subunit S [Mariprofundus erugo]
MKAGWQTQKLADIIEVQNGFAFKSKDYSTTGHFVMRIGNVQDGYISKSDPKFIQLPEDGSLKRFELHENDILVSLTGNVGRIGVVQNDHLPAALNQRVARIRLASEKNVTQQFLLMFLLSAKFRDDLTARGHGAAQQNVSTKDILDIDFSYPPLEEQRRIVAILDEAFEGIATATANAEKNLANAREVFESYLNSIFKKTTHYPYHTLKDVAVDFGRGKSKHRPRNDPKLYGGEYPFIQTGDIRNATHLITEFTQTYNEVGLSQSKLWLEGTLCITIAANIAETAILGFDACFPDSVIGFVPDHTKADVHYVQYLLTFFKAELQAQGKGSAQDNINLGTFEKQRFPFPPLSDQKRIVSELDALIEESQKISDVYEQKLAALDELKKSILNKALIGELN